MNVSTADLEDYVFTPHFLGSSSSHRTSKASSHFGTDAKIGALTIASYLTDPICNIREYFYTFYILDQVCSNTAEKVVRIAFLTLGIMLFTILAPATAALGIMIRGIVSATESKPYVYVMNGEAGKTLPANGQITVVSHNECYVPAGFSITDGQVLPSAYRERVDANIAAIRTLDPDIVCLYEVEDIRDASYISSCLRNYPFIIPYVGANPIGPCSMMYIASKYEIIEESIEYAPFENGTEVTGRSRFAKKGVLSFDIRNQGEEDAFVTVVSTHLQHSEVPDQPEEHERMSRAAQMRKIIGKIEEKVTQGGRVIFTGDLNQSEKEIYRFLDKHKITWLKRDPRVVGVSTWYGDQWCAELMGKPASGPQVLDYAFVAGKIASISTEIVATRYSSSEFRAEALSDHQLLFSTIALK